MDHALYAQNVDWISGVHNCPGFCGRVVNETAVITGEWIPHREFGDCKACSWGWRSGKDSVCKKCTTTLEFYDYCFLIFHALIPIFVNGFFIKFYSTIQLVNNANNRAFQRTRKLWLFFQILSVSVESSLALLIAILLFHPSGSLELRGCWKHGIREWYPMFYNPVINYTKTLRCSHELVYPLYSLPFLNQLFYLINFVLFRSSLYVFARLKFGVQLPTGPLYAAFWMMPMMACFHAFMSGLLYYIFPFVCIVGSLAMNAVYLAVEGGRKSVREMCQMLASVHHVEHALFLIVHASLLGFGLVAATWRSSDAWWFVRNASNEEGAFTLRLAATAVLLAVVLPLPTVFYVLTVRLTTPIRAVRYRRNSAKIRNTMDRRWSLPRKEFC